MCIGLAGRCVGDRHEVYLRDGTGLRVRESNMVRMERVTESHSISSEKPQHSYYTRPSNDVEQTTFEKICFSVHSRRGTETVYLHEFWSDLASALAGEDILAAFRAGVWVGILVDHFDKPERGLPLLTTFVGDAEWLPQQTQLATRNDAHWVPLTMDDADAGTHDCEKTMDARRCTRIGGVFIRPRVSYFALTRIEDGRPVRRAEQYILPGLLTTTSYGGAEHAFALLYACLRID